MRIVIPNYTFSAASKTVTFTDYASISLEGILLITNVTDNIIIYNFADATKGGSAATNVLTLDFDTTSMSDTDDIQILYDDTGSVEADNGDNVAVSALPNKLVVVNRNMMFDGSAWDRVRGTSADGLLVNLGTNNDVTVTGTVDLGATDNAVLDAIAASVAAIDTDTTTIIGHVDGIEGLLGTIDADTGGILTAIQLIDDAIVTAGTDTYTEASSKGQVLVAVRRDADTTLVNTTNEFAPLQVDANGYLKVEIFDGGGSHTVDNNGTFVVQVDGAALTALQDMDTDLTTIIGHVDGIEGLLTTIDADTGNIATSLQLIDDTIITLGTDTYTESTSKGQVIGAVRRDADTPLANTTNEFSPLITDANGYLKVEIFDGGGSHTVDNGGTFVVQENGAALTALQVMDDWDNAASDGASVSGDVAHDGIDAGEPVKIGFKAIAHGANPTAVAAADRTDAYANRHGIQFVIGGHPNTQLIQANYTDADGAQTNAAIITVSAGTKIVVTHITVTADNANTGDVQCRIGFGTANTPGNDAAKVLLSHPGIAPGSGISIGNGGGILGVGADDEDLRITCEDPAGGSLDVVVGYYTIES